MSTSPCTAYFRRAHILSAPLLAVAVALPALSIQGLAQSETDERPTVSRQKPATSNATIGMVNILLEQELISEEQAETLIQQAEDEAYVAREAARDATAAAGEAASAASIAAAAAAPPGSRRVTYVPEIVKRELRDEIRQEVMTQAQAEGWASPGTYPEWASRIRFYGDIRGRWEGLWFPGGFNSTHNLWDYNAINTGAPYDLNDVTNPFYAPSFNTTEDRNRFRLRARLGVEADLDDGFFAGMRIGTGSDNSPVSTNQTLGGSGGNFSKYALWLDRAFVTWEPLKNPYFGALVPAADTSALSMTFGRFDNPFFAPTDLVWDSDLGFDGLAIKARHEVAPGFTPFVNAGAMPIFNTSLDFATTEPVKFESADKYMLGGQVGFNWQATPDVGLTLGAGLFEFSNVQGKLSSPCDVSLSESCDTDDYRPSFAQKGNTYQYLRDIVPPDGWNGIDPYANPQYFGLANEYRPLVISGRVDLGYFDPIHVSLDGEFVWNTAFDKHAAGTVAVNNRGTDIDDATPGVYEGGDLGWMARLMVGHQALDEFGKWNVNLGYRYLESDAVLDAFVDSDFGLGGTNLKGYFLGADLALSESVTASAKWTSATEISGAPYAVDTFQLGLSARF